MCPPFLPEMRQLRTREGHILSSACKRRHDRPWRQEGLHNSIADTGDAGDATRTVRKSANASSGSIIDCCRARKCDRGTSGCVVCCTFQRSGCRRGWTLARRRVPGLNQMYLYNVSHTCYTERPETSARSIKCTCIIYLILVTPSRTPTAPAVLHSPSVVKAKYLTSLALSTPPSTHQHIGPAEHPPPHQATVAAPANPMAAPPAAAESAPPAAVAPVPAAAAVDVAPVVAEAAPAPAAAAVDVAPVVAEAASPAAVAPAPGPHGKIKSNSGFVYSWRIFLGTGR